MEQYLTSKRQKTKPTQEKKNDNYYDIVGADVSNLPKLKELNDNDAWLQNLTNELWRIDTIQQNIFYTTGIALNQVQKQKMALAYNYEMVISEINKRKAYYRNEENKLSSHYVKINSDRVFNKLMILGCTYPFVVDLIIKYKILDKEDISIALFCLIKNIEDNAHINLVNFRKIFNDCKSIIMATILPLNDHSPFETIEKFSFKLSIDSMDASYNSLLRNVFQICVNKTKNDEEENNHCKNRNAVFLIEGIVDMIKDFVYCGKVIFVVKK